MRDSRIVLFPGTPNLAVSTAATFNGNTIDLKSGYTGTYFDGNVGKSDYGIGVEFIFTTVTGNAVNATIKWQVSDDGSTWVDDVVVIDVTDIDAAIGTTGTKYIVPSRFETIRRYIRAVLTTSGMGSSSFVFNAFVSDGTPEAAWGKSYKRI